MQTMAMYLKTLINMYTCNKEIQNGTNCNWQ